MITVKELMDNPCQSSPDNKHWEPALPQYVLWRIRLRDAWAVLKGQASAIRQTTKADLANGTKVQYYEAAHNIKEKP